MAIGGLPGGSVANNLPAKQETWVQPLGQEDPLEKEMATHSSILAWNIPWTIACQAPLSMEFSRQEQWRGMSFLPPEDLPDPGVEPRSPALQVDTLPSEPSHINQLNKDKIQRTNIKSKKGKQQITHKEIPIRIAPDFSISTNQSM